MTQFAALGRTRMFIGFTLAAILLVGIIFAVQNNSANAIGTCTGVTANSAPTQHGSFAEYPLPHAGSGLMSPAIDAQGNIWFGEMGGNHLGRLNPKTQTITEWTPPRGQFGIMGIVADAHGNIWFAELAADYIGRFTPATCTFQTYATVGAHGKASGPTGIALAPNGNIWFTLQSADQVGVLNPATGKIQTYAVPSPFAGQSTVPYGITVDHTGIVWLTELIGNAVDRLDPATGKLHRYSLNATSTDANAITTAPNGTIWFTEMTKGILGTINPQTGVLTEYPAPTTYGPPAQLYDVLATAQGTIWLTSSGTNSLLRFDMNTHQWSAVAIPTPQSAPYGEAQGSDGAIWFTEAANAANNVGVYRGK